MGERWAPVPGYEGRYEVSTAGRVRSYAFSRPKILSQSIRRDDGYPRVTLILAGVRKTVAVHRLVATAFLGPRPDGLETRHLDGNAGNPRLENLRYGTPSQNAFDRIRHGTNRNAIKTHCPRNHEYTPDNTYVSPRGQRNCRTCARERRRAIWGTSATVVAA